MHWLVRSDGWSLCRDHPAVCGAGSDPEQGARRPHTSPRCGSPGSSRPRVQPTMIHPHGDRAHEHSTCPSCACVSPSRTRRHPLRRLRCCVPHTDLRGWRSRGPYSLVRDHGLFTTVARVRCRISSQPSEWLARVLAIPTPKDTHVPTYLQCPLVLQSARRLDRGPCGPRCGWEDRPVAGMACAPGGPPHPEHCEASYSAVWPCSLGHTLPRDHD
jgi:hypothetical protein